MLNVGVGMAMTPDTDMISRAEADRQTREAVAAALMEAAKIARAAPDGEIAYDDILALAADAPVAILAKWGARVRAEERDRCAKVADSAAKKMPAYGIREVDENGNVSWAPGSPWDRGWVEAGEAIAAAIREGEA